MFHTQAALAAQQQEVLAAVVRRVLLRTSHQALGQMAQQELLIDLAAVVAERVALHPVLVVLVVLVALLLEVVVAGHLPAELPVLVVQVAQAEFVFTHGDGDDN